MGGELLPRLLLPVFVPSIDGKRSPSNTLGSLGMEKKYFVYAFDIADKMITAALYCQDEKTAKWACRNAKDKMETDTDGFVFGVASLKKENKALENMNVGAFKDYATVAYPTG